LSRRIFRPSASRIFDYDLSREEHRCFGSCNSAMKSVPAAEQALLRSGQRATYLETRYLRTPDQRYNYPEATSWRYGWFHRQN
ncbi:CG13581, partial [Drosophila busckii]